MILSAFVRLVDRAQQRRRWLAFPVAVVKKFGEDQAGNLAALIAYYGFFSLFPLLLVLVTALAMALPGNAGLQQVVVDSALRDFPVIGTQLARNVHSLTGSGPALAIGIVLMLWAGLGVVRATETAMNSLWNVPFQERPNLIRSTVRALLMLAALGAITLTSALSASLSAGLGGGWASLGILASLGLNLLLFAIAFRVLTAEELSLHDVWTGAVIGAVAWTLLQATGGYFVAHQLRTASDTYGAFAVVIGLLGWMYLGAQVTLFAAEVNVVKRRHLWPRALVQPPFTSADIDALNGYVEQEKRRPEQQVMGRIIQPPHDKGAGRVRAPAPDSLTTGSRPAESDAS